MGIGIDVGTNKDYSYLFQSLSSGGMGNLNFLSDYASLKNGSYGKLMKTYYNKVQNSSAEESSSSSSNSSKSSSKSSVLDKIIDAQMHPKVSKDVQEANANLVTGLSNMRSSVSALQSDKTYTDTANGQSAASKVVSAMKDYVADYNNVVNAARGSTMTNKTAYVANMMSSTAANADKLSEIGVTINSSGLLQVNEEKLKSADLSKVQELFSANDIMSYGSVVSSRLQFAGATASTSTSAGSTNTVTGSTDTNNTAGSSAAALKDAGRALASEELYKKITDKDGNETYDIDKIFATAKSFVSNYNSMFDKAESSSNSGVVANLSYIREKTANSADLLKQLGISVDGKGRMKIDEDTFKKSDMSKVQEVFEEYGSSVATNASLVDYYTTTQANAASGYTASGTYNVQGSSRYADAF